MHHNESILTEVDGALAILTLNRPGVHNAMDLDMIRQLTESMESLAEQTGIRIVVLRSEGKHFSAGADLKWMREGLALSKEQLESESLELARLFRIIYESDLMMLVALQGKVMGGANGLVAAADLVIAEKTSNFAFSEVKLGLVPATIAPYVLRKVSHSKTAELMLTGRTFDAEEARSAGLVHYTCEEGTLMETTGQIVRDLLSGGPEALKGIKRLLHNLVPGQITDEIQEHTANLLAHFRISAEGQEGINAFFEKRKPGWNETP